MKNLDFKMRERFHRREQDEDRSEAMEFRKISKMKAASYADCDIANHIESCEDCGFCKKERTDATQQ